jgi:hypothetical protein
MKHPSLAIHLLSAWLVLWAVVLRSEAQTPQTIAFGETKKGVRPGATFTFAASVGQKVSMQMGLAKRDGSCPFCFYVPRLSLVSPGGEVLSTVSGGDLANALVDQLTLPQAGVYSIRCQADGNQLGEYNVSLFAYGVANAADDDGGSLVLGRAVSFTMDVADFDSFTFDGVAGQFIYASLVDSSSFPASVEDSLYSAVLSPAGNLLGEASGGGGFGLRMNMLRLPDSGTYSILCRRGNRDQFDNSPYVYELGVASVPGPNPGAGGGGVIRPGQSIAGAQIGGTDVDVYNFEGSVGQWVSINLAYISPIGLDLVYPSGKTVPVEFMGPDDPFSGVRSILLFPLPETGVYSIVCAFQRQGGTFYDLTLDVQPGGGEDKEGGVIASGQTLSAMMHSSDLDLYSFDGAKGQKASIEMSIDPNNTPILDLVSPAGKRLVTVSGTLFDSARLASFLLPETGTYFVVCRGRISSDPVGYRLSLQLEDPGLVTSPNDDGPGSLRQVVKDALPGGTIRFGPSLSGLTLVLTAGELVLDKNLELIGPGAGALSISGGNRRRVMRVAAGVSVRMTGVTIRDGKSAATSGDGEDGGGILNLGNLTLDSCNLIGNQTADGASASIGPFEIPSEGGRHGGRGGAIFNGGSLSLINCRLLGNSTGGGTARRDLNFFGGGGKGGAIFNDTAGFLGIERCVVATNRTGSGAGNGRGGSGGGLYTQGTNQVLVREASFVGNTTGRGGDAFYGRGAPIGPGPSFVAGPSGLGGDGAGVYAEGSVRFEGCGFFSNLAGRGGIGLDYPGGSFEPSPGGRGGGLAASAAVEVINCTFSGNRAGAGGISFRSGGLGASGGGGGAIQAAGFVFLRNCTVVGNAAGVGGASVTPTSLAGPTGSGGGLIIQGAGGVSALNSIIAMNTGQFPDVAGTVTSLGHNLVGNTEGSVGFGAAGDGISANFPDGLEIGPLGDHGGPTLTHSLLPGSPAINAGSGESILDLPFDQRGAGYPRVFGPKVDIGAYEFGTATGFRLAPGGLRVRHQGLPNSSLKFLRTDRLGSSPWETIHSGNSGPSGYLEYRDPIVSDSPEQHRFYRVIVEP